MKIAFVTQPWDTFTPGSGGKSSISILTHQLARRLAQAHAVTVYVAQDGTQPAQEQDAWGITYRRGRVRHNDRRFLKLARWLSRIVPGWRSQDPDFASPFYRLSYSLPVALSLRRLRPDVIHVHNFAQFVPLIRALNPHSKIVLHMHCEWLVQLDHTTITRRLRDADRILSCSNYVTQKTRQRFPAFAERCHTLFNGVEVRDYVANGAQPAAAPAPEEAKTLLFVGRLSPEKGVHVLLDAFREVLAVYPQARLKVVGAFGAVDPTFTVQISDDPIVRQLAIFYDGESYATHLAQRQPAHVMAQVDFCGFMPHDEVLALYHHSDVFVCPSVWHEPFGMPVVEALACGVPLVATRSGGIPEIVAEGEYGRLVPRNDATALAAGILDVLGREAEWPALAAAGRQRVASCFSWEVIAADLAAHYDSLFS